MHIQVRNARMLSLLIVSLTTEACMMLGQIPDPRTGKGQVHLPYARHTIDMLEMLEQKTELAENIIGSGERWLTELSTDQLRDLLELRREAVGDEV